MKDTKKKAELSEKLAKLKAEYGEGDVEETSEKEDWSDTDNGEVIIEDDDEDKVEDLEDSESVEDDDADESDEDTELADEDSEQESEESDYAESDGEYVEVTEVKLPYKNCMRCSHLMPSAWQKIGPKGAKIDFAKAYDCFGEDGCPAMLFTFYYDPITQEEVNQAADSLLHGNSTPLEELLEKADTVSPESRKIVVARVLECARSMQKLV